MTPPSGWLCDPQRPVFVNGAHHLYYLHSTQNNGQGGWDHASTTDAVAFTHHGVALPLQPDFPVWSGSAVVDTANTAGFGAGAIVVLATQPTDGIRKYQEQYLYWSTDGGYTFTALADPVIVNTDGRAATTQAEIDNAEWFRDPKIHWDAARNEWVCVIGRARYAAFYTSVNLRDWQLKRNFDYPNHALGVGVSVGRSADGARHTNIGKYGAELYVDRAPSDLAGYSLVPYTRAAAPIDAAARSVHLRIFVDTQSVEVFVNAGHTVLSQQVQFTGGDTGISFYSDGGPAVFSGITIRAF
ncbi:glycoside hydrolase family 32 protein [Arthrobacter sp. 135MFCol5.1]|uniref:glycoside hydrolase family 32 protein n=1 Tax=Arthrobacter sp. 135MFCol5.1 TaxID=1158050 RepID=UPI0012DFC90B|nr:glycoside hydrolase family 32 protein [Arthrobacter sp. 135MFCol5.1]